MTGTNYTDPNGPRFSGPLPAPAQLARGDTLLIVSFNIEHAQEIDSAIAVLQSEPLAGADIVLLQEMTDSTTKVIADAMGMAWVYYPATYRKATEQDFGNAVLSRWPITGDSKVVLPHLAIFGRTQRTATVATVDIHGLPLRVYSVHLATIANMSFRDRRDQMRAVLRDAGPHAFVVLGGDFNDGKMGDLAESRLYTWPTRDGPRTATVGRLDHIFLRGFLPPADGAAGTVTENRGASDHNPVWVRAVLHRSWGR